MFAALREGAGDADEAGGVRRLDLQHPAIGGDGPGAVVAPVADAGQGELGRGVVRQQLGEVLDQHLGFRGGAGLEARQTEQIEGGRVVGFERQRLAEQRLGPGGVAGGVPRDSCLEQAIRAVRFGVGGECGHGATVTIIWTTMIADS